MERTVGGRPGPLGAGDGRVPTPDQVTVPAQHGLWPYQQPQPVQHLTRQPMDQAGEHRPVRGREPNLLLVQLPFEDSDLVAKDEDLGILVPVTHREQPQQRHRVRHAEVDQSNQHGRSSSRSDWQRSEASTDMPIPARSP
jgi:hypothetical protein